MTGLRLLARSWHRSAIGLAMLALAVRLIVPASYMPDAHHFALVICTGHGPMAATMVMPHDKSSPTDSADKSDQPCGFGGTLVSSLASIDPIILLSAIAFIVALGITAVAVLPERWREWLRPPLRAPPALDVA